MNDGKMWVYVEIGDTRYWGNLVDLPEAIDVADAVATLAEHGLKHIGVKVGFTYKRDDIDG